MYRIYINYIFYFHPAFGYVCSSQHPSQKQVDATYFLVLVLWFLISVAPQRPPRGRPKAQGAADSAGHEDLVITHAPLSDLENRPTFSGNIKSYKIYNILDFPL